MQEHNFCVLVSVDILMHTREKETKLIASGTLPRLNYYKNAFVSQAASWVYLSHIAGSRKGLERKGRKPIATSALSQALNPGWLHLWIIIPH